MALTKCPECGGDVSDKAVACPHCGCPLNVQPISNQGLTPAQAKPSGMSIAAFVMAVLSVVCIFGGAADLLAAIVFVPVSLILILMDYRTKGNHAFSIVAVLIDILIVIGVGYMYLSEKGII